jgi:hypothetical protein
MRENAEQRHPLRELFNGLRYIRYGVAWGDAQRPAALLAGGRHCGLSAGAACHPLRCQQPGREFACRAQAIREAPDVMVAIGYVDQGYGGESIAKRRSVRRRAQGLQTARGQARLRDVAKAMGRGALLRLATRRRRLVKDYERYALTLARFHIVAFVCFMLKNALYSPQAHNDFWSRETASIN